MTESEMRQAVKAVRDVCLPKNKISEGTYLSILIREEWYYADKQIW